MFNGQYESGKRENIQLFGALRLCLIKSILRFLALSLSYCRGYNKLFDQRAMITFLGFESESNLVNNVCMVDLSSNFSSSTQNYQSSFFMNKHSMKMIMVQVMERVIENKATEQELELLDIVKMFVCNSGLLENQLQIVEQ